MENGLNIVRLQVKNFLSISDIEMKPGQINQIVGANNQGKTSILRAIEVAFKGSTDGTLVKHGESQAEIIIECSDGLNVHRRIRSTGTQDVRVSKNEMEAKAPQNLLNSLFETSAFNPLELLEPKRRAEALLQAIPARLSLEQVTKALSPLPIELPPLDYDAHGLKVIGQLHDYFYARRADANKIAKAEASSFEHETAKVPMEGPAPGERDDSQLDTLMGEASAKAKSIKKRAEEVLLKKQRLGDIDDRIIRTTHEITTLKQQLATAEATLQNCGNEKETLKKDLAGYEGDSGECQKLAEEHSRLQGEKTKNAERRAWQTQVDALAAQLTRTRKAKDFAESLDGSLTIIKGQLKEDMFKGLVMPVPGIVYENDAFYFEGSAIENLSTSASMKLAVALARSLAKKTKIICLDGAEALDDQNFGELKTSIADDGFTYFITKVGLPFAGSKASEVTEMQNGRVTQ